MAAPVVGHLDPVFLEIMDRTMALLRETFQTSNELTIPISGTGSAGMEAAIASLVEPGDTIVVGANGLFGQRMVDVAERYGANVVTVEAEWGQPLNPGVVREALAKAGSPKLLAVVHVETSTGVIQPLPDLAAAAHDVGALFLVDAVTSLGGSNLSVDEWGIDVCYSGTQKCLGVPPGLAPITLSETARETLHRRSTKVQSWYLDLSMIENYWGEGRAYHHTAPISMIYALHEGLQLIHEEGLEPRFARHRRNSTALRSGLDALGLSLVVPEQFRSDPLTTVYIPGGADDTTTRRDLLERHGIEIGGGLGPFRGRIWRIGLMGHSSSAANVLFFLTALSDVLASQGLELPVDGAVARAATALR
jgi:alanine-glyoxylate transaminase/serine-glyoxylate transaminase/serine-pyruvate transaminase